MAFDQTPAASQPSRPAPRRRIWRPLVLLFGLAISIAVAGIVHSLLQDERRAQDEANRQSLSAGLQSHIDRKLGFVRFLRGLYDSSDFVSVDEFERFARLDPAVHDGQWWFTVAWAPRQGSTDAVANGFADSDVFPLAYIEPAHGTSPSRTNAAADPADRAAMRRAASLQKMVVSAPQPIAGNVGMQVKAFMPIYKNGDRVSGNLQGFLIANIAIDGFFNDFLQNAFTDPAFSLRIFAGDTPVFARGPAEAERSTIELTIGDQHWRLQMGRAGQAISAEIWLPALVCVIGLALTAMLYVHLLRTDSEYRRISAEVGLATAELASANSSLAERSAALQRVADDLRRTSHEAELASSAKTVFLANMSHELRTPLNAIIGFAELVAHRALGEQSPRYFEYARDIETSGRYLLSIIEDLLDMSRIELGQVRLSETAVEPKELVESVIKFVAHRAGERRMSIALDGIADMPRIQADPRTLRQALINLLINAIKFSPPGGTITVSGALETSGELALAVQDKGPGIQPEDMAKIFEPFWQGDAYRRKSRDGVGLGLAITKRLIEAHGGRIEIISAPDQGTRAVIHLPAGRVLRGKPNLAVIQRGGSAA